MNEPEQTAPPKALAQIVQHQIALAAGTEAFQNRDPVYHISESFRQTFSLLGARQCGSGLYSTHIEEPGEMLDGADHRVDGDTAVGAEAFSEKERKQTDSRFFDKTSMDGVFASDSRREEGFLNRFSQTAFNRGHMSGAVMRGTGQMMLVSCLQRTAGQSQPKNFRQRMLFENASATRNVRGHTPDKVVFNKGETDSAIGLVVDVVRDARRSVDSLVSLLEHGPEGRQGSGSGTLQKMYPFLVTEQEDALLSKYKGMLASLGGDSENVEKRKVLQHAITKTEAVIAKKHQMRAAFVQHLRMLSDQATAALLLFSQEGFRDSLMSALASGGELPPPSGEPGAESSQTLQQDFGVYEPDKKDEDG